MRPYKEYEKLRANFVKVMEERAKTEGRDAYNWEPDDYVMFGSLMKEITEVVKSPEYSEKLLASYKKVPTNKFELVSLMVIAICLSAALDKNVSKNELMTVVEKYYHDSYHTKQNFDHYTEIAEKELKGPKQSR